MPGDSLEDLMLVMGPLPEPIIRKISSDILGQLKYIHRKLNSPYGRIDLTQVLFDQYCSSKLNLGIGNLLPTNTN
jgi:hypothetical protein